MRVGKQIAMNSVWYSLAWKEWHEHKWKLAAIVAVLVGVTTASLLATDRDRFSLAGVMLFVCMLPLALFLGLGAAAGERSRGTLPFLQSLPVPTWKAAVAKLIAGLLTIVVAVGITVATFSIWQVVFDLLGVGYRDSIRAMTENRAPLEIGIWYVDVTLMCVLAGVTIYGWSAAAGVNCKDEISAGALALAVMVGWASLMLFVCDLLAGTTGRGQVWMQVLLLGTLPGGFFGDYLLHQAPQYRPLFLLSLGFTMALLVSWYVLRFGTIAVGSVRSPQAAVPLNRRLEWLGPPRQSAFSALAWKQFRESGSIALAGLVGIVGISLFFAMLDANAKFQEIYATVAVSLGFGIALVAGIGIVLHELSPQLNNFWRSRPINPDLWFWTKYTTGLAIVVLAIYVPLVFLTEFGTSGYVDSDAIVLCPALHVATFATAVAMTCLVRHAVYAAVLSTGAIGLSVVVAAGIAWIAIAVRSGMLPAWQEPTTSIVLSGLVGCFIVGTLLAWLAARYDWGQKSRY
jgi:ABC-type transport system involved in multi-copper enzyme maturation permease subunit